MEREIKIGQAVFKVYDFFVLGLIMVLAILAAVVSGAMNLNISGSIAGPVIIGVELAYVFGVINRRSHKS